MKLLYLLFIVLALTISVKAEIYTTSDGHQVEIVLKADKDEIVLGEPVYLSLIIRNLSTKDVGFVNGGDYRNQFGRPDSFKIEVSDADGNKLPEIKAGFSMGGLVGVRRIAVGKEANIRFLLPHWAEIEKPGFYTVICKKNMVIRAYDKTSLTEKINSAGVPVNVSTDLKVNPANSQEVGKIIDSLTAKMLEKPENPDLEAVQMMSFIKDKRVIKPFAALIEQSASRQDAFYQLTFAFRTLAKFKDEAAFQSIISQISAQDKNIRREVSLALSKSVNPRAGEYLLKMQNDAAPEIRLDVVHYLGANKSARSTEILRRMTKDESEFVRKEALRYLEERGEKLNNEN